VNSGGYNALVDYLQALETTLTIVLGWLLGLLTPMIAERIRRPYRRRDLMKSVVHEMLDLQYVMAFIAYRVRVKKGTVSNAFLDEILPIVESYDGPSADKELVNRVKTVRDVPEEQRSRAFRAVNRPDGAIGLRQYGLPLLTTQVVELVICGTEFQRAVLQIRQHLDLFNQIGLYAQSQFDKTFSAISAENREILIRNQEEAYSDAGTRGEIIMRAIGKLKKQYDE
jgi:hypothetical protein